MSDFAELLKVVFYPARVLFAVAATAWFVMLMPASWARGLHVDELRQRYGLWVTLAGLLFGALWVAQLFASAREWWEARRTDHDAIGHLAHLSDPERIVIAWCIWRDQRTAYLAVTDSAGASLASKGIVESATGYMNKFAVPYTVRPAVWRYLRTHGPALIGMAAGGEPPADVLAALQDFEISMKRRNSMGRFD